MLNKSEPKRNPLSSLPFELEELEKLEKEVSSTNLRDI